MAWESAFDDSFFAEAEAFADPVRIGLAASLILLAEFGPSLKRPHCDTLKGALHANM